MTDHVPWDRENPEARYLPPLEPRPDPWTGLPRPTGTGAPSAFRRRTGPPEIVPTNPPPDGRGPALEWTYNTPRTTYLIGGAILAYGIGLMTYASHGLSWVTAWGAWVFIAVVVAGMWRGAGAVTLEVGADWLRVRRTWVDLYGLVRIRGNYFQKMDWILEDSAGRRLKVTNEWLWDNPDVWPLVRNGFEHSIVAGAETNRPARRVLGIGGGSAAAGTVADAAPTPDDSGWPVLPRPDPLTGLPRSTPVGQR